MNVLYKITNKINDKFYIGSTDREEKRFKDHFKFLDRTINIQHNQLHMDIKELGIDNFSYEVLHKNEDKVLISRMESKMIRENKNNELMYNKMVGASGRRVFYESDIIFIRDLYAEKKLYITEAYDMYYKDIVSFRAFKKVWHGETFKDIHYDVYTQENKNWHFAKGQSRPGEKNRSAKLTEKEVLYIRSLRDNGHDRLKLYHSQYEDKISLTGFTDIWNNKNWTYLL